MSVTDPVLLVGFNRPELMAVVLQRLREVQPSRLFIAVDGPRVDRPGEGELVQQCRDLVLTVDWPCEVRTLFQEVNLGCGLGVSTAITWFFDQVERGIILEDDIVPDPSFFPFCGELLDRYQDDERVFAISGCNYVPRSALSHPELSYRFSRVPHIWGWATWKRSWVKHRLDISDWRKHLPVRQLWSRVDHSLPGTLYWSSTFELLGRGQIDTWDGQFVLSAMAHDQWTATANTNLIANIGFGQSATHTKVDRDDLQPLGQMVSPLPSVPVEIDHRADSWTRKHHFLATWTGMTGQAARYVKGMVRRTT